MAYFSSEQSIGAAANFNDREILRIIGDHFMGNHPAVPFQYRIDFMDGIRCGENGRYRFNLGERFLDAAVGDCCLAKGKLFSYSSRSAVFDLAAIGPTVCTVNGEEVCRTAPHEEGMRQTVRFRVSLHKGWNEFVFSTEKSVRGLGFVFGNTMPQWEPYLFQNPLAGREGQLGFVYSEPISPERAQRALSAGEAREQGDLRWYPAEERTAAADQLRPEAVYGEDWTGCVCAAAALDAAQGCMLRIRKGQQGKTQEVGDADQQEAGDADQQKTRETAWQKTGNAKQRETERAEALCICLDEVWHTPVFDEGVWTLPVPSGRHMILAELQREDSDGRYWIQAENGCLKCPDSVRGYDGTWVYLGPFETRGVVPDASRVLSGRAQGDWKDGAHWRSGIRGGVVRMCVESELFGRWTYPMGVTLYGLLTSAEYLGDARAAEYVKRDVEQIVQNHSYAVYDQKQFGFPGINQQICWLSELDDCGSFGALMLECQRRRPDEAARRLADRIARYMMEEQRREADGAFSRGDDTMWIDDLYMSVPFLVRYAQISGDSAYLDEACRQMLCFRKRFFMEDKELMSHIYDVRWKCANRIPWSRGNGWVIFSLSELLARLPETHRDYAAVRDFYREMVRGIYRTQGTHGLWHQVLDDPETYEESSSTAMFTAAFARGIRYGYADPAFEAQMRESVRRGWHGLITRAVDASGNLYGVCQGSGCSFSRSYYRDLSWRYNDPHGIGIVLLAGVEACLLQEERPGSEG